MPVKGGGKGGNMPPLIIQVRKTADNELYCRDDPATKIITDKHGNKNVEIQWHADENVGEFRIVFELDTPFNDNSFEKTSTGRWIREEVRMHHTTIGYVYSVHPAQASEQRLKGSDPGLIIKP
jgi:hypothetical protein